MVKYICKNILCIFSFILKTMIFCNTLLLDENSRSEDYHVGNKKKEKKSVSSEANYGPKCDKIVSKI